MGVNIMVYDADHNEVPETEWDGFRYAGDRDLVALMRPLPKVKVERTYEDDPCQELVEVGFRPADFAAWRVVEAHYKAPHNPGRFKELIDVLEANPGYYVWISW